MSSDLCPHARDTTRGEPCPDLADLDDSEPCMTCGGDGVEDAGQLMAEDPLWWEGVSCITCRNCGGTGKADDQTYF